MISSLSVVVPVYNSEHSLPELCRRLNVVLESLVDNYEIILINDGSQDGSWSQIMTLAEANPRIRGFHLMRNFGQHNAILAGTRSAKMELILTLDDDLQNPPEEIPNLLAKLEEGFDVVYGVPAKEQHGFLRDCASMATKLVLKKAMGADIARNISAFRIFRTKLRQAFEDYNSNFISIDVLLTWATTKFARLKVEHHPRTIGVSNYTLRKLLVHALNMMTGFSTIPLQVASLLGFALTFFGLLVLVYVLGRYLLQGSVVPGFAFLASIIAVFSGAQLFALGIIGEYLSRMHFRSLSKPPYVIDQSTDHPLSEQATVWIETSKPETSGL